MYVESPCPTSSQIFTPDPIFYARTQTYLVGETIFRLVLPQRISGGPSHHQRLSPEASTKFESENERDSDIVDVDSRVDVEDFIVFAGAVSPWMKVPTQVTQDDSESIIEITTLLRALSVIRLEPRLGIYEEYVVRSVERLGSNFFTPISWFIQGAIYDVHAWRILACKGLMLQPLRMGSIYLLGEHGFGSETITRLHEMGYLFDRAVDREENAPRCYRCDTNAVTRRFRYTGGNAWLRVCHCGQLKCLVGPSPKENHLSDIVQELFEELFNPQLTVKAEPEELVIQTVEPPRKRRKGSEKTLPIDAENGLLDSTAPSNDACS